MNKKPKVIFVDWYGTLSKSKFWGHLEKTDKETLAKIEKSLFNSKDTINSWMRGLSTSENIIENICKETGLDYKKVFKEFIFSCNNMTFVSNEIPNLISKLKKKGYKVIIATDNMDSFSRWTSPSLKLNDTFDDVLNSFEIKYLKRDSDDGGKSLFFKEFIKNNNLKRGESILLDDSEDKDGVISSLGIKYVRIGDSYPLMKRLEELLYL